MPGVESRPPAESPRRYVRPGVYLGIVVVLAMITGVALSEAISFEAAYQARERRALADGLTQVVGQWETLMVERMLPWYGALATADDIGSLEARHRRGDDFFDAYYLWDRDEMVFPPMATEEDIVALRAEPCLERVGEVADQNPGDPVRVAAEYARCGGPDAALTLFAISEAAELLVNAHQPAAADRLVRRLGRLVSSPLTQGAAAGVDVRRVVILRLQHARAMEALGRVDIAQAWLSGLAEEVALLDAPLLERTLDLYQFPLATDLRAYGGPQLGGEGDELQSRAERRLAAWRELRTVNLDPRALPLPGEPPRVFVDPYADPPWLVFASRLGVGDLVGAVQVDQAALLRWLLKRTSPNLRPYLSIRDSGGRVVAGSSEELAVTADFPQALRHLRAGITVSAVSTEAQTRRAFVARLLPFFIAIGVGGIALLALIRNDRQQEILLQRQRDFVARVSHELKTPLAGIRVMAETIEMGAVKDEAQRAAFARRIVEEAERLTARVNEVIRAATRPSDDVPVDTDVDALVAEVAATWTARFAQAGGSLTLEASPVGGARVMPVLLRDALNNLLDNALKYRHPDRPGRAWLRVRAERRWIVFEVEDDGIGVPAAERRAVFERFRRVEGPGRGKAGGHGLGLSFVAETARLHGGKAECLDGVAGGARLVLRIRRRR